MLRAAFRPADIEKDELFWKMKKWERANHRYPLLKRWRDLDPLGDYILAYYRKAVAAAG